MRISRKFESLFIILSLFLFSCGQNKTTSSGTYTPEIPVPVDGEEDLFRAGQFYFGGQPDEELLRWLADEGVEVVINVRTNSEMETHTNEEFDEYTVAGDLRMKYFHFPTGGDAGYSTHVVDTLAQTVRENPGKTFIHCKSGGRACYVWVAYLIRHKHVPVDVAVDIGKKMKFRFILEELLGYPLSMKPRA